MNEFARRFREISNKIEPLKYTRHIIIPDAQVKPNVPTNHLEAAGNYIAEKRPDVVVVLGDWWDMPSLSLWDSPQKKALEKRAVISDGINEGDFEAGNEAFRVFNEAFKIKGYNPRKVFLMGNHEYRINRFQEEYPHLRGAISLDHLNISDYDYEIYPFLQPVVIDGVSYCHFFCRNAQGKVTGSRNGQPSARAQVIREGMSCTAGHKQGLDTHIQETATGRHRGVIAGSFYQHSEDYLTPQGNDHWQGILMKHEVRDGDYDLMEVSLNFLLRNYL